MTYRIAKRILDVIVASVALVLLIPLLAVVAALVRIRLGWPIFFCQERAGKDGVPFRMFKFRSMTSGKDRAGNLLPDIDRITAFGRFLRASSLDELPELLNILRGEMSIVGPRPLLTCYVDRYTEEQKRRLEVTPGLTGWAQINGRNNLTWEQKFELDNWYVDHANFSLDLKIAIMTFGRVFRQSGVVTDSQTLAPEFLPTNPPSQNN